MGSIAKTCEDNAMAIDADRQDARAGAELRSAARAVWRSCGVGGTENSCEATRFRQNNHGFFLRGLRRKIRPIGLSDEQKRNGGWEGAIAAGFGVCKSRAMCVGLLLFSMPLFKEGHT